MVAATSPPPGNVSRAREGVAARAAAARRGRRGESRHALPLPQKGRESHTKPPQPFMPTAVGRAAASGRPWPRVGPPCPDIVGSARARVSARARPARSSLLARCTPGRRADGGRTQQTPAASVPSDASAPPPNETHLRDTPHP